MNHFPLESFHVRFYYHVKLAMRLQPASRSSTYHYFDSFDSLQNSILAPLLESADVDGCSDAITKLGATLDLRGLALENGRRGWVTLGKALRKATVVTELDLTSAKLSQHASDLIEELGTDRQPTLCKINLSNIDLSNSRSDLIRALEDNKCLRSIDLSNCKLNDGAADNLASKLFVENSTLQIIRLDGNNLGKNGSRELADYIVRNTTLTSVSLSQQGAELDPEAAATIKETCEV